VVTRLEAVGHRREEKGETLAEVGRPAWAERLGIRDQALLPWMRLEVDGEEHVEKAGQQCGRAVLHAHDVAPPRGALDLAAKRAQSASKQRVILRHNGRAKGLRVRHARRLVEMCKPAVAIKKRA
jgi:hypothetical protein